MYRAQCTVATPFYKYAPVQNIHTLMLICTDTGTHTCSNTHSKLEVLKTDESSLGL